jgi:DNA invertase Pin-like site-specific DNA recombinase
VLVVTKLDRLGRNAMDGRLSSEVRGRPRDLGLISLQRCTSPGNGRGRR